jgi:hypothetical protein
MLKQLVHLHPNKLHTFDDFYRNSSKPIKTRSNTIATNDLNSTTSLSSSYPLSPSSPSNTTSYTFYSVFSDFKSYPSDDVLPEEDETESSEAIKQDSNCATPLFYLEEEHQIASAPSSQQISTSTPSNSPHWPALIRNRFRHHHHHHQHSGLIRQATVPEGQLFSNKLRKNDSIDSSSLKHSSHGLFQRMKTMDESTTSSSRKSSQSIGDDFPELSAPTLAASKKHRSLASVFHHFHSNHSTNHHSKHSDKYQSTGALNPDIHTDNTHQKLVKQQTYPPSDGFDSSPVTKSPSTPILPKLVSLFHRHHHHSHQSEHYKYRVGNLKARLHHRKRSPPSSTLETKFQCQSSNELIRHLETEKISSIVDDEEKFLEMDHSRYQRSVKPVVMKRVHTWHNTFDLRPIDQCLEY